MNTLEILERLEAIREVCLETRTGPIGGILTSAREIDDMVHSLVDDIQSGLDAQAPKIAGLSKEAALAYFHPQLFRSLPTWSTMPRIGEKCTLPTPPLASPSEQEEIQLSAAQDDEMHEDYKSRDIPIFRISSYPINNNLPDQDNYRKPINYRQS